MLTIGTYIFYVLNTKIFRLWWQNMHLLNISRRIYNIQLQPSNLANFKSHKMQNHRASCQDAIITKC